MLKGYTHIEILLDKSGSMTSIRGATIDGFNRFISKQREAADKCTVSLSVFNQVLTPSLFTFNDLDSIPLLTPETYVPNGPTALYDSLCYRIDTLGKQLSNLPESLRPENVVFLILTDGYENASKIYLAADVKQRIEEQINKYNWNFTYIGANQEAILVAREIGIFSQMTMDFAATAQGTLNSFDIIGTKMKDYRTTGNVADIYYKDEDRVKAMAE